MVIKLSMENIKFFYTNIRKCNIKRILFYCLLISDNLAVNRLVFILQSNTSTISDAYFGIYRTCHRQLLSNTW